MFEPFKIFKPQTQPSREAGPLIRSEIIIARTMEDAHRKSLLLGAADDYELKALLGDQDSVAVQGLLPGLLYFFFGATKDEHVPLLEITQKRRLRASFWSFKDALKPYGPKGWPMNGGRSVLRPVQPKGEIVPPPLLEDHRGKSPVYK